MEQPGEEKRRSPLLGLRVGEIGSEILILFGEDPGVV